VLVLLAATVSTCSAAFVNVESEYAPGKSYVTWQATGLAYNYCCNTVDLDFRATVPADSPYSLTDCTQYICTAGFNNVLLPYQGDGVWSDGTHTLRVLTTTPKISGWELMDPSWTYENPRPSGYDLAFPVISLGGGNPGDYKDIHWKIYVDFAQDGGTFELWQETYGTATAVPEPSTLPVLLSGLGACALAWRRRRLR
jgi:hypothetical protein